ncbi:serine hydrolase [Bacteroidota bacterium]
MKPHSFNQNLYIIIIIACFSINCFVTNGQSNVPKIEEVLKVYYEDTELNGVVLVADEGEIIFHKAYGKANFDLNVDNDISGKFQIYSMSKQFTAILTLMYLQDGKIHLEDKVSKYLPYYPKEVGDKITIHNLLTHSHGLIGPDYNEIPASQFYDLDSMVYNFYSKGFEFEPGSSFHYGIGFIIMAAIIEEITSKPFPTVMKEMIFDPLEMNDTKYYDRKDILSNYTSSYTFENGIMVNRTLRDLTQFIGSSGMVSSSSDLLKWHNALRTNKLLSTEIQDLAFTKHIPANNRHYGYGFYLHDIEVNETTKNIAWHSGGGTSVIMRSLDDNKVVIILNNITVNSHVDAASTIMQILYDAIYEMPKKSISKVISKEINSNGIESAVNKFNELKESNSNEYNFSEQQLNSAGYELINAEQYLDAVAILKLNVKSFPESANVYDSLAEAYMLKGDKELAIENYKKSLELNPENTNAKNMLNKLIQK